MSVFMRLETINWIFQLCICLIEILVNIAKWHEKSLRFRRIPLSQIKYQEPENTILFCAVRRMHRLNYSNYDKANHAFLNFAHF